MEEKTLMQTLMEIDQDINREYRESKYPKFFKNIILKKNRKGLVNAINDYCNKEVIYADELNYYVHQIADIYGGNYLHCRKVEYDVDNNIIAVFQTDVHDTEAKVAAIFTIKEKTMTIRYSLFNKIGAKEFGFGEDNVEMMVNRKKHSRIVFPWPISDQPDCVKDLIAETILGDIKSFLDEMIVRSERINANE